MIDFNSYDIFESESLSYPGYIEWNKENIVTFCGKTKIFKIWNHSYKFLFQIHDLLISDLRLGYNFNFLSNLF